MDRPSVGSHSNGSDDGEEKRTTQACAFDWELTTIVFLGLVDGQALLPSSSSVVPIENLA